MSPWIFAVVAFVHLFYPAHLKNAIVSYSLDWKTKSKETVH